MKPCVCCWSLRLAALHSKSASQSASAPGPHLVSGSYVLLPSGDLRPSVCKLMSVLPPGTVSA